MILLIYVENENKLSRESFESYLQSLPEYLQEKILRYHRWKDAQASLYGKLLLQEILTNHQRGFSMNDLRFQLEGRPYISECFDFNISHSGSYVVCAYSDEGKIGIDLEVRKEIDIFNFSSIFSEYEFNCLKSCNNANHLFYHFWTKKEAAIKADGRGLSIPLKEVRIEGDSVYIESNRWFIHKIDLFNNYSMHFATENPLTQPIQIKQIIY